MSRVLDQILLAARPLDVRGTVPQPRTTAALVSPASRVIELTARLEQYRNLLAVAGIEIQSWEAEAAARDAGIEREARYHSFQETSFGGIAMAQHWCDLVLWEAVLNTNPQIKGIIEIGTWQGGFSRWLNAQADTRGLRFRTFDVEIPNDPPPRFVKLDVYAAPQVVEKLIEEFTPCLLFCDGGNKPRELATFGPLVGPAGVVMVHDWGTETLPSDVPDALEEIYGDYCDELGSITRVFRVRP